VALQLALLASVAQAAAPRPAVSDTTGDSLRFIREVIVGTITCATCPPRVCTSKPVPITVRGEFPDACYTLRGLHELPVAAPFPVLLADIVYDGCSGGCPAVVTPFAGSAELPPPQTPGMHSFLLVERVRGCPDSTSVISSRSRMITYEVTYPCVPTDSVARALVNFAVSPAHPCAGDSVSLVMAKNGCPPCVDLTSLGPDIEGRLHATLDWRPDCVEFACFPETLTTPLGVFAPGHHVIDTRVDVHVLLAPAPDSTISFLARVEFDVPLACDTTTVPCMSPYLRAGFLREAGACALTVDPGGTGTLGLSMVPTVPLGGLEGRIDCSPPFRIVRATAVHDLAHVFSTPEGRGIRYLVITDLRFPFPAAPGPVMQLEIAADPGAPPGARGRLLPRITLASDVNGDSVALCDPRLIDPLPIPLCVTGGADCDANGDGRGDVRDLVLMTRCFRNVLSPEDSVRICRLCDTDSVFTISDLFCCAREILRGPARAARQRAPRRAAARELRSAPGDGRRGRGRRPHLGSRRTQRGPAAAHLPRRALARGGRADASGPAARGGRLVAVLGHQRAGTGLPGRSSHGRRRLGLLVPLVFTAIAPPLPGDRLEALGADLAGAAGTVLAPLDALPVITLDAPNPRGSAVALSAARPNPFTDHTSFVVTLPKPAQVDLAIHDLAGRRIATIARGPLDAGQRSFTWDGAGAAKGSTFVRLAVDGQVLSTRVALLKESR
jgi:hypothetical protein